MKKSLAVVLALAEALPTKDDTYNAQPATSPSQWLTAATMPPTGVQVEHLDLEVGQTGFFSPAKKLSDQAALALRFQRQLLPHHAGWRAGSRAGLLRGCLQLDQPGLEILADQLVHADKD